MKKMLIIGFVWPEPSSSAAGSRMIQLVEAFLSQGYQITFASTAQKSKQSFDLKTIGVSETFIELNSSTFDDFIKKLNPEAIMFDRFMTEEQFGWRVAETCPKALLILDTEDLHCLRKGRERAFFEGRKFTTASLLNDYTIREIASIYRCDLSLIISGFEMDLLKTYFKIPEKILLYLPFLEDEIDENTQSNLPRLEKRNHFVTVGTFKHEPNVQSVLHLKKNIWKLIREKLPEAQLHIYGAYAIQRIEQLHNPKEGFIVKGFTEDILSTLEKYKVCLAPLQFGAGLKGKLLDAMKSGTPCVMSSIAAEGMFGELPPNGFIEDDDINFAEKAIKLATIDKIYNEFQLNGYQCVKINYNKQNFNKLLNRKITALSSNLYSHRQENFIGLMLQHHTLKSNKYMSKWIEEKNK